MMSKNCTEEDRNAFPHELPHIGIYIITTLYATIHVGKVFLSPSLHLHIPLFITLLSLFVIVSKLACCVLPLSVSSIFVVVSEMIN